jgi:hypothetical protein
MRMKLNGVGLNTQTKAEDVAREKATKWSCAHLPTPGVQQRGVNMRGVVALKKFKVPIPTGRNFRPSGVVR